MRMGLSSFDLKMIAMLSMFIDHLGAIVFPECIWMRYIGRLAFPIYCFLLSEGFEHTKSVEVYLKRLFVFAVLSEGIFDFAFYGTFLEAEHQNVFFTLCFGLFLLEKLSQESSASVKLFWGVGIAVAAEFLHLDYGAGGIMTVLIFWKFRENKAALTLAMVLIHGILNRGIQSFAVLALLPIFLYNGKKGTNLKYLFYTFYPAHLLFLVLLNQIVLRMYG